MPVLTEPAVTPVATSRTRDAKATGGLGKVVVVEVVVVDAVVVVEFRAGLFCRPGELGEDPPDSA